MECWLLEVPRLRSKVKNNSLLLLKYRYSRNTAQNYVTLYHKEIQLLRHSGSNSDNHVSSVRPGADKINSFVIIILSRKFGYQLVMGKVREKKKNSESCEKQAFLSQQIYFLD